MTTIKCPDSGGTPITLGCTEGRHLTPNITEEQWNAMRKLATRPDDVFICAYPKSGFHWMWEITSMLRSGDATPIKTLMEYHILDFVPIEQMSVLDERTSPRTFTSHKYPDELPQTALEQKCKIVYLIRDPKDICVSYYNHLFQLLPVEYDGEFNDFVELFLDGKVPFDSWSEHIKHWSNYKEKNPSHPFITIYYEDAKKDPVSEIRRLASFLEVEASEDFISDIARNTKFETMKSMKESLNSPLGVYFKTGKEIMYRKGEVGDWANWFSDSKSREFDEAIKSQIQGINYHSLLQPDRYSCML